MEIRKLFGQQEAAQSGNAKKQREAEQSAGEASGRSIGAKGEDVVSLSPLSRQLSQISQVLSEDEIKRANRIQELKKAVSDGTYQVSSTDVARSIISFAAESPQPREV